MKIIKDYHGNLLRFNMESDKNNGINYNEKIISVILKDIMVERWTVKDRKAILDLTKEDIILKIAPNKILENNIFDNYIELNLNEYRNNIENDIKITVQMLEKKHKIDFEKMLDKEVIVKHSEIMGFTIQREDYLNTVFAKLEGELIENKDEMISKYPNIKEGEKAKLQDLCNLVKKHKNEQNRI